MGRISGGREVPQASSVARGERLIPVLAPTATKAALYLAIGQAGITNAHLARIKEALEVFGKRLVVSVEAAA